MKSQYYVPLYDTENGGPPDAFKCLICQQKRHDDNDVPYERRKTITLSEPGMLSHLMQFHGIEVKTIPLWQNKEDSQQPPQAPQATMQKNERSTQNGGEHNQE